eukprot:jgi/Undpi1/7470/HiC_scaffold_22.g09943.m1
MILSWALPPSSASPTTAAPMALSCHWIDARPAFFLRQHRLCTKVYAANSDSKHDDDRLLPMLRGPFLQRVLVGSSALSVTLAVDPALSLDAQRDARTARPPPAALLLPVVRLKAAAIKVVNLLAQPGSWEEARLLLQSPPLSSTAFTTILDRYSDSNWENHMLGDLYRNQGLASLKELNEVMAFALQQETNGVHVTQDDIDDVREAGQTLATSLDNFLSLAPADDLRLVYKLEESSSF